MVVQVNSTEENKRGASYWTCRVIDDEKVVFDSSMVSIKYLSEDSARWLADIMERLYRLNIEFPGNSIEIWEGNLEDDCSRERDKYYAHAEHLEGPRGKGGIWYCQVSVGSNRFFHTADYEVQPRSGKAARWLCEVIILAAQNGIIDSYPD